MVPPKPRRMDGYIRQSRAPRGESISPEQQEQRIRAWADSRGVEVAAMERDIDRTGAKIERPGLDRILGRIEAGATDGIIVAKLDRLSRAGLIDSLRLIERIHAAGGAFASDDFGLDPTSKEGELVLGLMLGLARWEHRRLSEGWVDSKVAAIERGAHLGPAPIGYAAGEDGVLVRDEDRAPVISALFERAATGRHGDSALARFASERMTRPGGGSTFAPSEVRRWLRSRTYLGEVRSGDLVNARAHPALTDPATFANAQREPGVRRRNLGEAFPLSGIVRCAACRYAMTGATGGGSDGATRVYRCSRSSRGDGGGHSLIVADRLERYVEQATLDRIEAMTDEDAERMSEAGDPAALADLERRVAEAEAAAAMLATAPDADADWLADVRARAADLDRLRADRDAAAERVRVGTGLAEVRFAFVRRGRQPVEQRVKIVWADEPSPDVPGPGRPGPFAPVTW